MNETARALQITLLERIGQTIRQRAHGPNGNTGGIFGNATGWAYNGFVSNPVGRLVTVGVRTRF